jgi:hypothetical protein
MEQNGEGADLESCARQIVFLSQRFARMKRVEFMVDPAEDRLRVPKTRFEVMMAIFDVMGACLETLPQQSRVHIRVEAVDRVPGLCFQWPDTPAGNDLVQPIVSMISTTLPEGLPQGVSITGNERNASVRLSFA